MKSPLMTVTNDAGRTYVVRYLPAGARYGRANCLTDDSDEAQVEFYDATYADDTDGDYEPMLNRLTGAARMFIGKPLPIAVHGFGPLGQFVSRYFVRTLLGEDGSSTGTGGLCLDGGHADVWSVDGESMRKVRDWLRDTRTTVSA